MGSLVLWVSVAVSALPAVAQVNVRATVYAALLSGAGYHGVRGSQMLVRDEWIPIRPIGDAAVAAWLREFDAVPAELREALRRPAVFNRAPVDRSLFPVGTRFISPEAIAAVFTRTPWDDWPVFKRQYKAEGWVSFSDVLVTSDGLDALVYTEGHCGSLCAQGGYIWLHRTGPAAPWSIVKDITSWIA